MRPIFAAIVACLLTTALTACANSEIGEAVEKSLAADPKLKENPSTTRQTSNSQTSRPPASPAPTETPETDSRTNKGRSPERADKELNPPQQPTEPQAGSTGSRTSTDSSTDSSTDEDIPLALRAYVTDLMELGVLRSSFAPNETMTRREYLRWLVAANNKIYAHDPGKQIRLASKSAKPVFQDLPPTDPDFPIIQGLAEAGILTSRLTGDSTVVLFRPDAPVTRERLILWKVPLDIRRALPAATIDGVKETWGFQDAAKIDPKSLRAVLADYQNGEKANIRRSFGYTNLFQPTKTVSSLEAAASLWYFGYQGEGISASEAIDIARSKEQTPTVSGQ